LGAACRLLFRLSKREGNDESFRREGTLDRLLDLILAALSSPSGLSGLGGGSTSSNPSLRPGVAPGTSSNLEPLLYALGALKNASTACAENASHLAEQGAIELLARVLRDLGGEGNGGSGSIVNSGGGGAAVASAGVGEARAQVCVQVTALLRNLASVSAGHRKRLIAHGLVEDLCRLLDEPRPASAASALPRPGRPGRTALPAAATQLKAASGELCLNVFRTLAKLTLSEDGRAAINADPRHIPSMVRALRAHRRNEQLLVRACFVLGNLTASNGPNRERIGLELGGCDLLLSLLAEATVTASSPQIELADAENFGENLAGPKGESGGNPGAVDVLVKLVRLVAHLAMAPSVGAELAARREVGWLVTVLESFPIDSTEELLLNAASAITNLSFYRSTSAESELSPGLPDPPGFPSELPPPPEGLLSDPSRLVRALTPLLLHSNPEAVTEAGYFLPLFFALFCCCLLALFAFFAIFTVCYIF